MAHYQQKAKMCVRKYQSKGMIKWLYMMLETVSKTLQCSLGYCDR